MMNKMLLSSQLAKEIRKMAANPFRKNFNDMTQEVILNECTRFLCVSRWE